MKRIISVIITAVIAFGAMFTGCGEESSGSAVTVCFANSDRNGLVEKKTEIVPEAAASVQAEMLLDAMSDESLMPDNAQALIEDKNMVLGFEINEKIIYVDMDRSFDRLSASDKLLLRAGLTKTLQQVPGIRSVGILVDGEPAKDSYGNPIGPTSSSAFLENPSKEINEYINTNMLLYFSDVSGEKLVPESRRVYYSSNAPLEEVVVSEIIKGPYESGKLAVFPSDTNILSVTIQDDICYINFDESISNAAASEVDPYVQIYSLVNSIQSVCNVSRVSFSVNGSSDYDYAGEIAFNTIFEPRKDLITTVNDN